MLLLLLSLPRRRISRHQRILSLAFKSKKATRVFFGDEGHLRAPAHAAQPAVVQCVCALLSGAHLHDRRECHGPLVFRSRRGGTRNAFTACCHVASRQEGVLRRVLILDTITIVP